LVVWFGFIFFTHINKDINSTQAAYKQAHK
jgi:hypothetical protein